MNAILKCEDDLRDSNYILHPTPDNHYWVNISAGRLRKFVARCGDAFNIVLVGHENEEGDFYAIPYRVLKEALTESFLSNDKTSRARWIAQIKHHQIKVGRYPVLIDVGAYYGCQGVLTDPGVDLAAADDFNDYAIENRKIEISQRQKQSVFRRRILQNFEGRCCLSGVTEDQLLVASHIVPWAKRINTRLDPANGLLLHSLYDRLFDAGFISFDDELRVHVSPLVTQYSSPLRAILEPLAGQQARHPIKWAIKPEYLAYHRAEVLQGGLAAHEPTVASSGQVRAPKLDSVCRDSLPVIPPTRTDEWERKLFGAAVDVGVSVPDAALSSDGLYD